MAEVSFRDIYVNHDLLSAWSSDGVNVDWYNPVDRVSTQKTKIESLYYFDFKGGFRSFSVMQIERTDINFRHVLSFLRDGDNMLVRKRGDFVARNAFLFQYLRTPNFFKEDYSKCMGRKTLPFLSRFKGRSYFTDVEEDFVVLKGHLAAMSDFALTSALESMDLEAALLHAPEGKSFVVGPNPVSTFNPFFEKRFAVTKMDDKAYDLYGSVMILPVSPSLSVMLYDDSIYSLSSPDNIVLSPEDVDLLNVAQIYNADIDGGVVYSGLDTSYLDSLRDKLADTPYREAYAWFTPERYPVPMLLSVMSINEEAQKNLVKYAKAPLREHVKKVRAFSSSAHANRRDGDNPKLDLINYTLSLIGVDHDIVCEEHEIEE